MDDLERQFEEAMRTIKRCLEKMNEHLEQTLSLYQQHTESQSDKRKTTQEMIVLKSTIITSENNE